MRIGLIGLLIFPFLARAAGAAVDAEALQRFEQTLDEVLERRYRTPPGLKLSEIARIRYGAYTTLSGLAVDDEPGNTRILRQVDAKFWLQAQARGHTFYGRLRLRYRDFNTGDAFLREDDDLEEPIGDRYWYRFDWRDDERAESGRDPGWNWWLQVGRQQVHWMSGLVLSEALYAARPGFETRHWRVEGLLAFTPNTGTIDFDASRPNYAADVERFFWGASVEYLGWSGHRPFVSFIAQNDENENDFAGAVFAYDSRYVSAGSSGQIVSGAWLYRVEFVYEFGDSASAIGGVFPQTMDDISAWAGRLLLTWLPQAQRRPLRLRVEFELLLGSGDDDRGHPSQTVGGNLSGTDDEAFNSFGFFNTGLAFAAELSNLVSLRLGASAMPFSGPLWDRFRIAVDAFLFAKLDEDAAISVLSLPGETYAGTEIDLIVEWQILSDVALDLRYGIFVPGDAIPDSDPRHFFYVGFSYGF